MSKTPTKTKPRNLGEAIASVVTKATVKWTATKKSEERRPSSVIYRRVRMTAERSVSQKDAAAQVMEAAWLAASTNATLPAQARQVMYAARPKIQELTGGRPLDDQYFCQTLLPDYMEEHGVEWDVVFDARGHFTEPHTRTVVNLGTLGVRSYLAGIGEAKFQEAAMNRAHVSTRGPDGNFGAVLFIEKEGFQPLFDRVRLDETHDVAVMSPKGLSSTAARQLVDEMCGAHNIPLLVLHDFDVDGFTILDTLRRDTRRYQFENEFEVIDLGLRLADVEAMGLPSEAAATSKSSPAKIRARLSNCGATPEECDFLVHRRVELNAMTSGQLVEFVKRKLEEHGVKKIIPSKRELDEAFRLFERGQRAEEMFDEMMMDPTQKGATPPRDLKKRVDEILRKAPTLRWDAAVRQVLGQGK